MSAVAELPDGPRPAELRVSLSGLRLAIGRRDGSAGYQVLLDPPTARKLAADLVRNADQVELQAAPALEELAGILRRDRRHA